MDLTIPTDEFVISHGTSRFKAAERVADLKRKKKSGRVFAALPCLFLQYML